MHEENFSRWLMWTERKNAPGKNLPGVYVIAHTNKNLAHVEFSWCEEIIYIGVTNSLGGLASRLRHFDNTISGKTLGHGGADRVRYRHQNYNTLYPKLFVAIAPFDCAVKSKLPDDLRTMGKVVEFEYLCFAQYVENFGKLPEFNDMKASPKYSLKMKSSKAVKGEKEKEKP